MPDLEIRRITAASAAVMFIAAALAHALSLVQSGATSKWTTSLFIYAALFAASVLNRGNPRIPLFLAGITCGASILFLGSEVGIPGTYGVSAIVLFSIFALREF